MDKVVQQNAAYAQECASTSEELNAQAMTLQEVVQELTSVTGGGNDDHYHTEVMRTDAQRKQNENTPLLEQKTKKAHYRAARPDQLIPFDGSRFKDF